MQLRTHDVSNKCEREGLTGQRPHNINALSNVNEGTEYEQDQLHAAQTQLDPPKLTYSIANICFIKCFDIDHNSAEICVIHLELPESR